MGNAVATAPDVGSLPLANARHERFCQEYLIDRNGQAAYERAGYGARGDVAKSAASRLLTNVNVSSRVAYLEAQRAERVGMTADQVLRELAVLGTSDVRHYTFSETGITLAADAPDEAMRAVASVKRRLRRIRRAEGPAEEVEEVEFRLWNKPAALRMAGEAHRLFVTKVEQEVPVVPQETGEQNIARLVVLLPRVIAHLPINKRELLRWLERGKAREELLVSGRTVKGKGASG